jgi:hypothetical protein
LQGDLHLRESRDGNFRWQQIVQDAVAAQIAMRQDIVADLLALPQAAAMADHQPAMRARHRQMVGNGFGVGGADADIHDGDAIDPVAAMQVVGRHLEALPGRLRQRRQG